MSLTAPKWDAGEKILSQKKMNHNTHKQRLVEQMHSYVMFMLGCGDPDDVNKLNAELQRIKGQIEDINKMTESQQYEQVQTITIIIESSMKYVTKLPDGKQSD